MVEREEDEDAGWDEEKSGESSMQDGRVEDGTVKPKCG
jgi:hypothetical protein